MNYLESVQTAIDFIEENMEMNVELEEVANISCMSLPHLYRMFYSLTGHPVKDYMRKRRLSIASEHLKNSTRKVIDIAMEVGFESQASFTKSFKKIVGVTPKVYKSSDMFYSFERINLYERVNYLEGRDLFDRYPDVKVIQIKDMTVLSYIHRSDCLEGIEKDAFTAVQHLIQNSNLSMKKVKLLGRNIELDHDEGSDFNRNLFAYEMMVAIEEPIVNSIAGMHIKKIHGGMYAVGATPSNCEHDILSLWNRLYSEWLPKSVFKEGAHTYLEEYITYNQKLVRMKLYLPIERQLEPEMITVEETEPFWVAFSRIYGHDSQHKADATLSDWLKTDAFIDYSKAKLYVSYNYGAENGLEHWSECGITTKYSKAEGISNPYINQKRLGGGLFAVIETKAYGTLNGVLEIIHRWIVSEEKYILDDSRQWFAQYQTSSFDSSNHNVLVRSYIPIMERKKLYE